MDTAPSIVNTESMCLSVNWRKLCMTRSDTPEGGEVPGLVVTEYSPVPLTYDIPCEWNPPKQTDRAPLPVYPLPGDLPILEIRR